MQDVTKDVPILILIIGDTPLRGREVKVAEGSDVANQLTLKQGDCPGLSRWTNVITMHVQVCVRAKWLQSCLTLCDPMNCSPSGSSVHGILQARILEWVAVPFSRGSSRPVDRTWASCIVRQILYSLSHQGSPPPPDNAITKSFKWRQESQCQREKDKPDFPGFEGGRGHKPRDFGRLQVLEKASINGFFP